MPSNATRNALRIHPTTDPLTETQTLAFDALVDVVHDRTHLDYGLELIAHESTQRATTAEQPASDDTTDAPVTSALPFTKRLPMCIRYDSDVHGIVCTGCERRYAPTLAGLRRGIDCCSSLAQVDRDDVPICEVNLTLSPHERAESEYSDRQLPSGNLVRGACCTDVLSRDFQGGTSPVGTQQIIVDCTNSP